MQDQLSNSSLDTKAGFWLATVLNPDKTVILSQRLRTGWHYFNDTKVDKTSEIWSISLSGGALRHIEHRIYLTMRAHGEAMLEWNSPDDVQMIQLGETEGSRLGLIMLAIKPITRQDRAEWIIARIQGLAVEEVSYWFSKCSSPVKSESRRAAKALRVLLSSE